MSELHTKNSCSTECPRFQYCDGKTIKFGHYPSGQGFTDEICEHTQDLLQVILNRINGGNMEKDE
jgi:hypothetical protein